MENMINVAAKEIPPLRQSLQDVMACPKFYVTSIIEGNKQPSGIESARGTQVHSTMSRYAAWCAYKSVGQDLKKFDDFSRGAGPQAAKILAGIRDGYIVDHAHLLATEVMMSLDENFDPTDTSHAIEGIAGDSGLSPAYQGTLDALYVFRQESAILIEDFKTHMRPFDPNDSLQAKMYSLFVYKHFPWVETVTFRLLFVRYAKLSREVTYSRSDIAALIEIVKSARDRQQSLHDDENEGKAPDAIAGTHCTWCPLLSNRECPIADWNPQMQLTPEQRLNFALWYSQFSRLNNATLKAHVDGTGRPVTLKDYNGKSYVFGPVETESEVYPLFEGTEISISTECMGCGILLPYVPEGGKCPACASGQVKLKMPIVNLLESAAFANPRDTDWMGKLLISSTELKSKLKTKKRVHLDQAVHDTADKVTKVSLRISKPLDAVPEEDEDDEEIVP